MDQNDFDALMVKLEAATWTGKNLTSNTKIFITEVNDQEIKLYELGNLVDTEDNRPNLYVNGRAPYLTEVQLGVLNTFGESLLASFSTEIAAAISEEQQQLEIDVQAVIS